MLAKQSKPSVENGWWATTSWSFSGVSEFSFVLHRERGMRSVALKRTKQVEMCTVFGAHSMVKWRKHSDKYTRQFDSPEQFVSEWSKLTTTMKCTLVCLSAWNSNHGDSSLATTFVAFSHHRFTSGPMDSLTNRISTLKWRERFILWKMLEIFVDEPSTGSGRPLCHSKEKKGYTRKPQALNRIRWCKRKTKINQ